MGEIVGSFRLEKVLGEGAMGKVYLGRHTRLERAVALKVLHPKHLRDPVLVQRFLQEAKTVNQINHHHIVEVHDFVEEMLPERVYCVMELLDGQTLAERMKAGPLSLEHGVRICRQVAEALGAAHEVGVVHRDVKPDNIFLVHREGQNDYVKVLDFGVAKLVESLSKTASLVDTLSGQLVGTPRYMAPEQAAGIEVDHRADIYALGTILYELLAGRPPFVASTFGQLSAEIITRPPPPLPATTPTGDAIPKPLQSLVMECLAKSADDRPVKMSQVVARFDQVLELTSPEGTAAVRRPPVLPLALGGVAAVALVALLLVRPWAAPPAVVEPRVVVKEVPVPALAPALPKTVSLSVTSTPPGATVTRRDTKAKLGVTPFTLQVDRVEGEVVLDIKREDYEPAQRTVRLDANGAVDLSLTAKPKKKKSVVQDGVLDPFAD